MFDPPTRVHISNESQHQHHAALFRRKAYHHEVNHPSHLALRFKFSHNITAASPMAPPIMPPTASILPAPLVLFDDAVGLGAVVLEAVDEVAAADEVLAGRAWTSVGLRVPQVLQA